MEKHFKTYNFDLKLTDCTVCLICDEIVLAG